MSSVRTRYPAPLSSHSIKALHYIGNVETLDRYQLGAPIKRKAQSIYRTPGMLIQMIDCVCCLILL